MPFNFAPKLSFAHSIAPKSISLVQRLEVVPEQNLLLLSSAAINFSEILSFISIRNEGLTFEILLFIWYSNGAKIPDTCHPWNHSGVEWSSLIKCPADLPTVGCEVCTALLLVSKKPSTVGLTAFYFSQKCGFSAKIWRASLFGDAKDFITFIGWYIYPGMPCEQFI